MEDKDAPKGPFLSGKSLLDLAEEADSMLMPNDAFDAKCQDVDSIEKLFGSYISPSIECGNVSSSNSQYIEQQKKVVQQQIEEKDLIAEGLLSEKNNTNDTDYLPLILGWQAKKKIPLFLLKQMVEKRKHQAIVASSSDEHETTEEETEDVDLAEKIDIPEVKEKKVDNNQYTCPECNKPLHRRDIKAHQAWHDQTRSYPCDRCQLAFYDECLFKLHCKSDRHNTIPTAGPSASQSPGMIVCGIQRCSYHTAQAGSMKSHQKTPHGEKIKCLFCSFECVSKGEYGQHAACHKNEMVCHKCGHKATSH